MSTSAYPVHAPLQYVKASRDGEELFVYKYELPQGIDKPSNLEIDEVDVDFTDLRTVEEPFDILRNGFQLERLEVPNDIDWDDDKDVRLSLFDPQRPAAVVVTGRSNSACWLQIQERYYPLVEKLLKQVAGASRIHIFDHTIRKAPVK